VVDTLDQVSLHTIEDMIDFSLNKIEHPLNMIPKTPLGNESEPDDFEFDEEGFNLDHSVSVSDDMEENSDNNEERENPPQNNQPWLDRDTMEIPGWVHNLP
jgi:hypothetical protein